MVIYKMVDVERIVGFDRDSGNERKSFDKQAVTQIEAQEVFQCADLLIHDDMRHSAAEARFHALGETLAGRKLHVTFTLRRDGTLIQVISARDMNAKEKRIYDKDA